MNLHFQNKEILMPLNHFSKTLKNLRKTKGFTQIQLAEKLDASVRHVQNLEKGEADPHLNCLVKLSKIFKVDLNTFSKDHFHNEGSYFDSLSDAVQVVRVDGLILYSNLAAEKFFGISRNELSGKRLIQEFIHDEKERKEISGYFKYLAQNKPRPLPYVSVSLTSDGRQIPVENHWNYLLDENKNVIAFLCVYRERRHF